MLQPSSNKSQLKSTTSRSLTAWSKAIDQWFLAKTTKLSQFKRFIISYSLLLILLIIVSVWQLLTVLNFNKVLAFEPGNVLNVGVYGQITNLNPIYATSTTNSLASRLLFAGLFAYNGQNKLVGQLASHYSVSSSDKNYFVYLKHHLLWQDGRPITAQDVVFTIKTIQNPLADSPLLSNWQGVNVQALNKYEIEFSLPNPLASFIYNLTVGLLPAHILAKTPINQLLYSNFNNQDPIGSGPFILNSSGTSNITNQPVLYLTPNNNFNGIRAKLAAINIYSFSQKANLEQSFLNGQINMIYGLEYLPANLTTNQISQQSNILTAANYLFYNTTNNLLSNTQLRQALSLAINPKKIIQAVNYPTEPVNEPLLFGQLGYNVKYAQTTDNLNQAKAILTSLGYSYRAGLLIKNNQPLSISIVVINNYYNRLVSGLIKGMWQKLGVKTTIIYTDPQSYQTIVADHNYQATLDSIAIGVDPDVYIYWDSNENYGDSSGYNLSLFSNQTADNALSLARTRLNPDIRILDYQPFLSAWQTSYPAVGLFQPRALLITNLKIAGLYAGPVNSLSGQFRFVQNWEIKTHLTSP